MHTSKLNTSYSNTTSRVENGAHINTYSNIFNVIAYFLIASFIPHLSITVLLSVGVILGIYISPRGHLSSSLNRYLGWNM